MESDINKLIIKGPFTIANDRYYRIYKKEAGEKTHYTVITPQVCITSCNCERGYLSFSVDDIRSDSKITALSKTLGQIETCVQSKTQGLKIHHNYTFRSCLGDWHNNRFVKCRMYQNNMNMYDHKGDVVSGGVNKLVRGSLVRILLWVKGLYITRENWGLQIIALQIRAYDISPPKTCVILDEDKPDKAKSISSTDISKYRHMQSMGVPIPAIKHKMEIDGVDPTLIDMQTKSTVNYGARSGVPRLNPGSLLQGLSSVSLKKTSPRKAKTKKPRQAPENQMVPSLEDILRIRGTLNSVKDRVIRKYKTDNDKPILGESI
jgi:hypothetical protein